MTFKIKETILTVFVILFWKISLQGTVHHYTEFLNQESNCLRPNMQQKCLLNNWLDSS